jgi:hypothetical protein
MTKANGQTRHFGSFRESVDALQALATDSFYQATPVTSSSRQI